MLQKHCQATTSKNIFEERKKKKERSEGRKGEKNNKWMGKIE